MQFGDKCRRIRPMSQSGTICIKSVTASTGSVSAGTAASTADIETTVLRVATYIRRARLQTLVGARLRRVDLELKSRLIDHVTAHLPSRSVTVSARAREIDATQLSCFYTILESYYTQHGDSCIRLYITSRLLSAKTERGTPVVFFSSSIIQLC